jgi:hypothetical protein
MEGVMLMASLGCDFAGLRARWMLPFSEAMNANRLAGHDAPRDGGQ